MKDTKAVDKAFSRRQIRGGQCTVLSILSCLLLLVAACDGAPTTPNPDDPTNPGTDEPTITLNVEISGQGSVSSTPEGLECSAPETSTCSAEFAENTSVILRARSADGWVFAGWNGEGCGVSETCELTLDAERSVTALFVDEATPKHVLTVERTGEGQGRVTTPDEKIDCPTDCSGTYFEGFTATLRAQAAENSTFEGWEGADCTGAECEVTLTGALTVTATFGVSNALPEIKGLSDQTLVQNTEQPHSGFELPFTISDAEDDASSLTPSVSTDSPEAIKDAAVSCAEGDCVLSFSANRDEALSAQIIVSVTDSAGGEGSSSLTLSISPRSFAPTANDAEQALRDALEGAEPGDVIGIEVSKNPSLVNTIPLSDELVIDKNVTIGHGPTFTLTGNEANRLLYINPGLSVTLDGLTLQDGRGQDGNGSTLSNAIGGAIVNRGTLMLRNVTLKDNRAEQGGAIYNVAGATLSLENVTAQANTATRSGGVIFNDQGTVTIANSAFTQNISERFGGVIYIYKKEPAEGADPGPDAVVTVANSTFSENRSQSSSVIANGYLGGTAQGCPSVESACVPYAGELTISGSTFTGNLSQPTDIVGANGSVSNFGTLTITNSSFENNEAPAGAALYTQFKSTTTLDNVTITGNRALDSTAGGTLTPGNAAGIYNEGLLTFQNGTTVSNNEAQNSGGGVFNNGFVGTLIVPTGNSITGNVADADENDTGEGGGVYNEGTASGIDGVAEGTVTGNTPTNFAGDQIEPSLSQPNVSRPRLTYRDHRP